MERILKIFVERDRNGKFVVLYTRKGAKDSVLIENLTKRQVESIYSLLTKLGFDVFFEGAKADIEDLSIAENAKVYLDEVFRTFRKLQPWEVLE
jgi:hypothetical protein